MKKKILFFIPSLAHGGAEKVLVNLANALDREKYDVYVRVLFDVGVNRQFLLPHVNYSYVFKKQFRANKHFFKLFSPKRLYKKYIGGGFDIVVSYLEGPTARIVGGCADKNTKTVSWIHIDLQTKKRACSPYRSARETQMCTNSFDHTVCVSETVKKCFTTLFEIDHPCTVLYNTVESDKVKTLSLETEGTEFLKSDVPTVCSVGKINSNKGFDRLARIHKKLIDEGIKHKMFVLGIGPDKEEIQKYLDDNGVADSFTFLGYHENPYKYVSKCSLFVCSSYREGFSTAATEALIVGTPVVTTLCSGMEEMLGNNEYGIITENNEDALYEGIKRMLTDKELLKHYAEKASERGALFSKEKTVAAVERLFDSLTEK